MTERGLHGPYPLTDVSINSVVLGVGPGAYALGTAGGFAGMTVQRVGRSDTDLNGRLHDPAGLYSSFEYGFFDTAEAAYRKECELYHREKPPGNPIHPDSPTGMGLSCHICGL